MDVKKLNWGILGTGKIAQSFAKAIGHSKTGHLQAVASREMGKAAAFSSEYGVPTCYGSYDELLQDEQVQAVYISTPHPQHAQWAIRAARAGKGILCEKPLAMNLAETKAVLDAAREHKVFLMEAFMFRCHPQSARIIELLRSGKIGELRFIQASFGFQAAFDAQSRLFNKALGGGAILDIGCYPASIARLMAGTALGLNQEAEPLELKAQALLNPVTGVDDLALAILKFPNDILAELRCSITVNLGAELNLIGSRGSLRVPVPYGPAHYGGSSQIIFSDGKGAMEVMEMNTPDWLFSLEIDAVARDWEQKQATFPASTWQDSLGNAALLDQWRQAIGLRYSQDSSQA